MIPGSLYIGLMSGTSVDAVDAVLVDMAAGNLEIKGHCSSPIPDALKEDIRALSHPGEDTVDLLGITDKRIALLFADTVLNLLSRNNLESHHITAIGSHGQTIRHRPNKADSTRHFTLQIGDPNTIAATTGITTVADFRRKDMALGGEGAPLVPAFHQHVFRDALHRRAVINIGGIANITWLPPASSDEHVLGFDTGPGNCLMDSWIQRHQCRPFDTDGNWAASGQVLPDLLEELLSEPYLDRMPPKSTGKETFNLSWLEERLVRTGKSMAPQDVQATLCRFTALSIARGLNLIQAAQVNDIYLCGGGALNSHLVQALRDALPGISLHSTAAIGIDPLHIEGAAFAWLAYQTLNRLPGNIPAVTGAQRDAILGGIYFP